MKYKLCEYFKQEQNDNLEMVYEIQAQDYIKKCIKENTKKYGKNYTQEDLIINEELQDIKKELFGI